MHSRYATNGQMPVNNLYPPHALQDSLCIAVTCFPYRAHTVPFLCHPSFIWRFPKIGVPLVIIHVNGIFPYNSSIFLFSFPHFRKPPYDCVICHIICRIWSQWNWSMTSCHHRLWATEFSKVQVRTNRPGLFPRQRLMGRNPFGGSINGGTPKWMVYKRKSQSKLDDDWG